MLRILITSAGRRVELIRCFRKAAMSIGMGLEVHACDFDPALSAGCREADHSFGVPLCSAPDYADVLFDYCRTNSIGLLVPTIDPELMPLAQARDRFAAAGTLVHVSGPETIAIVRDKERTTDVLRAAGVPVPRTGTPEEVLAAPDDWMWPLFIKPAGGSASRGIGVIRSADQLARNYSEPMILQELLQGTEFTVNIYVDQAGALMAAIPHRRLSIRAGEVEKGETVRRPEFEEIARTLVAALPDPAGVMCFQLIDDRTHGPKVFEINARFGGGYPLADTAGGRFAESLLARAIGQPECASNAWRENVLMLRYDAAVYHE